MVAINMRTPGTANATLGPYWSRIKGMLMVEKKDPKLTLK